MMISALQCANRVSRYSTTSGLHIRHYDDNKISLTLSTPLHRYTKSADTANVLKQIAIGANVDAKDDLGMTPLMLAVVVSESVKIIELLLNANASIYTTDTKGENVLGMVVEKNHKWLKEFHEYDKYYKMLDLIFERVKNHFYVDRELTLQRLRHSGVPISFVPFMGDVTITKYLIDHASDFVRYNDDTTILHVAVRRKDVENVRFLVTYLEDINIVDQKKRTAIFAHNVEKHESTDEEIEILKMILNNGASLTMRDFEGETPMGYLLKKGNRRTRGALFTSESFRKCAPSGDKVLFYLLQNVRIENKFKEDIQLLKSTGFDVNTREPRGTGVLIYTAQSRKSLFKILMENGAKVQWPEFVADTEMIQYIMGELDEHQVSYCNYYKKIVIIIFQYQLDINVKNLFRELNEGFSRKLDDLFYAQIVIAELAIAVATTGKHIDSDVLKYINSRAELKGHLNLCRERIKQLMTIKVNRSVTLYQLLTESDYKIMTYVCNHNLLSELQILISQKCYQSVYYVAIIRKRIEKAMEIVELRRTCRSIVSQLTGLDVYGVNEDHYVVYKIVNYLSKSDLLKLLEGQATLSKNQTSHPNTSSGLGNLVTRSIKKIFS